MREKIKLVSSAETGHYYTTTKNKRLHPDKVEVKKFDPVVRKHVMYKEEKIKQLFESFIKKPLRAAFFYVQFNQFWRIVSRGTLAAASW